MKKTVLIIDDSAPIRYLLEAILGKKYKIVSAMDVPTAMLWLANGNKPDLIISDIQMPGVDGWELIKYLNGNALYNDVPLIVLSGTEAPVGSAKEAYKYSEFIRKPFDPAGLMISVERNLEVAVALSA
ncbi:response regulator [Chitinophaga nivalis]|uniref:Response regulator n=1 Tax=Chitinophaga nivalis TaxID=2991709 RepID=A0ABT3ILQ4_9BACT|nr:response regulator [Chitinophaga nivalis]MCW3465416.1 response regulator [Chitinophaga nivalis]MCW3484892.1 response regulator [Chitinophaga nivalis]